MNRFELFTMVFHTLNHSWELNRTESVGNFLSEMNPFLWDDIGSADPAIYDEFSKFIKTDSISIDDSYTIASKYIESLKNEEITKAFSCIAEKEWKAAVRKYLKMEHKGGN